MSLRFSSSFLSYLIQNLSKKKKKKESQARPFPPDINCIYWNGMVFWEGGGKKELESHD